MLKDIIQVIPKENYQLYLKFEDGCEGVVDISQLIEFSGIFEPLQELNYFRSVEVHPEWGTIYWSNGADLDPDVLYSVVTGEQISLNNYQSSVTSDQ